MGGQARGYRSYGFSDSVSFRMCSDLWFRFARDGCRLRSKTAGRTEFTTKSTKDTKNGSDTKAWASSQLQCHLGGAVNRAGYYTSQVLFASFVVKQPCPSVRVLAHDPFSLVTHLE